MKISVAMAAYNGERFLREQLDSLAAQHRLPDELVVCDDDSSDRTLQVIREFSRAAPFPVRLYSNAERLGYGANFLKAASNCTGDWIAFCDQDDIWLPNKLSTIERYFDVDGRDVTLVVHSALVVDQALTSTGVKYPNIKKLRICAGAELPALWFAGGLTMTFRADLIKRCPPENRGPGHGARPEPLAHDAWISWLACILGDIVLLPDTLVLYRRHSTSATTNLAGSTEDIRASRRFLRAAVAALADRDASAYRRMSAALIAHSNAFCYIARQQENGSWREKLLAAADGYRSHAQWLAERGAACGDRAITNRFSHLWRAVMMGGYIRYYGSDFLRGFRALVKDIFSSVIGDERRRRILGKTNGT